MANLPRAPVRRSTFARLAATTLCILPLWANGSCLRSAPKRSPRCRLHNGNAFARAPKSTRRLREQRAPLRARPVTSTAAFSISTFAMSQRSRARHQARRPRPSSLQSTPASSTWNPPPTALRSFVCGCSARAELRSSTTSNAVWFVARRAGSLGCTDHGSPPTPSDNGAGRSRRRASPRALRGAVHPFLLRRGRCRCRAGTASSPASLSGCRVLRSRRAPRR